MSSGGVGDGLPILESMTVFALLAGIAIGVALGYLLARNRLGTAAATATERARAAQERAAILERAAAERTALADGQLAQRFDVEQLVGPMRETLARVEQQLRESDVARARSHAELAQQVEFTRRGAEQLREQTQSLVTALRRPEARGRWGEIQLRRVVELAGMAAHVDFDEQVIVEGGLRPDMVVRLAGGKNVIVDSKVSLAAYLEAASAADEAVREARLAAHARHLKAHVDQLASKAYWSALPETPEFVVMFVPGEAFLAPALDQDPGLLEHALSRRVHIATPTTLVSMLRTVQYAWQQEKLSENARAVFDLGRELYDRLSGLGTAPGARRQVADVRRRVLQPGGRHAGDPRAGQRAEAGGARRRGRGADRAGAGQRDRAAPVGAGA